MQAYVVWHLECTAGSCFISYPGGNLKILPGWKDTVDKYYKDIEAKVEAALTVHVEVLEAEIAQYDDVILMGEEDNNCRGGSPATSFPQLYFWVKQAIDGHLVRLTVKARDLRWRAPRHDTR
jgi:hypothetical protein